VKREVKSFDRGENEKFLQSYFDFQIIIKIKINTKK